MTLMHGRGMVSIVKRGCWTGVVVWSIWGRGGGSCGGVCFNEVYCTVYGEWGGL